MRDGAGSFADRPMVLEVVVFLAAATGMVLELAGSRLMAPYFGSSLFVWTSLIGVILAFMSVGNYVGGRLADRWVDATMLSWVLVWASLGVVGTAYAESLVLPALAANGATRLMSVVAACVLFSVPSTMLGIISPYSIRVRMHGLTHAGATVGALYAIGTIGSIAGTFAAGFWLISVMGAHNLVLLCAATLAALSALLIGRFDWRRVALLVLATVLIVVSWTTADSEALAIDTKYDRYLIREGADPQTGRPLIGLSRDYISAESASYSDTGEPFAFEYYSYYDLASGVRDVDTALLVGGGTFSYPRLFLSAHPTATIDVVEIDDELVGIAKEHFGLTDDERMSIFLEDGRMFLNRSEASYDAIFMDAFKSEATVPYQLTTVESWRLCYDLLDDDGVLVMNVVASPTDERAEFFHALYASIAAVFPQVEVYRVQADGEETGLQNTSIIASKSTDIDLQAELQRTWPESEAHRIVGYEIPAGTKLLTDDFAPVDQYLLGL